VRAALADLTYVPFRAEREGTSVVLYSPELDDNYVAADCQYSMATPRKPADAPMKGVAEMQDGSAGRGSEQPETASVTALRQPVPVAIAPFVGASDMPILVAAEKALDNGVGALFLLDDEGRPTGIATLDSIRSAVRNGDHGAGLGAVASPLEGAVPPTLETRLDSGGRLVAVEHRPEAEWLPVAEPDLGHAELRSVMDAFLSTWVSSAGAELRAFEARIAGLSGVPEGVAVTNGTVALHLAMEALGIGPGDEVIIPDLAFAACANTVIHVGARPVLADVDPDTWCLSPETIEPLITERTRAIMPIHVWGRPAPMTELCDFARRRGLFVIENCAEAHGARYDGRTVGSFGDVACFSFFANKIMTTGEGGMCLTSDPDLAARMRILRDHGMRPERRYWHEETGHNFRMTNLQAAIGLAQVERLDSLLAMRREVCDLYRAAFADRPDVIFPDTLGPKHEPVTWFSSVLVPPARRAAIVAACKARNIDIRPFTNGLSMMPAYARYARVCPVSRSIAEAGINLPTSRKVDARLAGVIAGIVKAAIGDVAAPAAVRASVGAA
jgi:perosamine synthetase